MGVCMLAREIYAFVCLSRVGRVTMMPSTTSSAATLPVLVTLTVKAPMGGACPNGSSTCLLASAAATAACTGDKSNATPAIAGAGASTTCVECNVGCGVSYSTGRHGQEKRAEWQREGGREMWQREGGKERVVKRGWQREGGKERVEKRGWKREGGKERVEKRGWQREGGMGKRRHGQETEAWRRAA